MSRILFDLVVGEFQQMAKAKDDRRDRFEVNLLYQILIAMNDRACNVRAQEKTQDLHRPQLSMGLLPVQNM